MASAGFASKDLHPLVQIAPLTAERNNRSHSPRCVSSAFKN